MNPSFSALDHRHMARALALAERGRYTTRPNPMVGCVIAQDAQVLGEGWHMRAGEPHAEVHALRAAGAAARGATAYVTLEPCSHHGRTPPCAQALIEAGVARVVAAIGDPYAEVCGRGFAALRAAGIGVEHGLLADQARHLNQGFLSRIERGRPWLRIKLAMSLDGRTALASGESKWISSAAARADVQHWRARAGAILTGAGTARADDPSLTVRIDVEHVPPLRVVLDSRGELPPDLRLFTDQAAPTLVCHAADHRPSLPASIQTLALPRGSDGLDLPALLAALAARGIGETLVEAGPTLAGALVRAGLADELLVYLAPVLLGSHGRPLLGGIEPATMAERLGLHLLASDRIGPDLRLRFGLAAREFD